ncbi:hypothetical protein [uncultured Nostoc sp.]|uniref:hypothetical protein n=1 Tax=uncultured Nostoc sp. TaxID=340711 RepID=UPI0035CA283F
MSLAIFSNAYSDELITATELNRQPGRILDKACEHPVTITRNDQSFALLRREDVAYLVKGMAQSKAAFEVVSAASGLVMGKKINSEHPYGWLGVFDADDLQDLIKELSDAFRLADISKNAWDLIDAIIHEWHESAIAISSPELAAAFNDEIDEIELTQPFVKSAV